MVLVGVGEKVGTLPSFQALPWQVLALMFIPMSYLLYKNQAQAGNFLISFVSIEGLIGVEVRPAPARAPPKSQARPSGWLDTATASRVADRAGALGRNQ